MKRWLYAYRQISGNPEALTETLKARIGDLLRQAAGPEVAPAAADGSLTLRGSTYAFCSMKLDSSSEIVFDPIDATKPVREKYGAKHAALIKRIEDTK
jgi:hypothetical protein